MAHSEIARSTWIASAARSVGMTVAVVAALLLGMAAAAYARAGDDGVDGAGAQERTDLGLR